MSIYTNPASSTPGEIATYVAGLLDLLGDKDPVQVLRDTPAALERFLATVPAQIVTRPEAPGKWSIRDVVRARPSSPPATRTNSRVATAIMKKPLV